MDRGLTFDRATVLKVSGPEKAGATLEVWKCWSRYVGETVQLNYAGALERVHPVSRLQGPPIITFNGELKCPDDWWVAEDFYNDHTMRLEVMYDREPD